VSDDKLFGSSRASLHAKAFVMDRKQVFIGSFNLDPRSDRENTEIGIVFDSSKLGTVMAEAFDDIVRRAAYRLTLDEQGKVLWHDDAASGETASSVEPETTWFQRFSVSALRLLPIESQL
jgi:putative cardiolipin synthase